MRYFELFLLACLCAYTHSDTSPQQQRCNALNSAAQYDQKLNLIQCTAGEGCFSLDCQPTTALSTVLLRDTDFHISIEPCKTPVSILVNATVLGVPYSHEFSHTETVNLTTVGPISPKLQVVINNTDSQVLVFSVVLIINENTNYTLVPPTNFPLNNISCSNGHLVTHPHTHAPPTHTPIPTFYCGETCQAVHRLVGRTNSRCHSTDKSCLTITCSPPANAVFELSSSYTILPCEQPPVVQVRFYEKKNDLHFVRNVSNSTTISVPNFPITVQLQITLVDINQYSILFGVNLLVAGLPSITILPNQVIPIDRTNCSWYTGLPCTATTAPISSVTTNINTNTHTNTNSPYSHPYHTTPSTTAHVNTSVDTGAGKGSPGSNVGTIAGIVVGTVFLTLLVVVVSVAATLGVVFVFYKKKAKGEYTYSQFRALEEDDC